MTSILAVHQGGGVGGAPVSLVTLLRALDGQRFQSRLVLTEPGPMADHARALGVPVEIVPTGGAFFASAHARVGPRMLARFVSTFPLALQRARARLRQARPDVLHLNTSVLLAWAAAARREGVPVVWVVREVLSPQPTLRRLHASYIQRHARDVVAISGAVRACFPTSACIHVVYNGVDLHEFRAELLAEAPAVRAELGLGPHQPTVMAIGSVQRPKGHWLLLDAFSRLAPDARLVLVAGGADPSYARSPRGRLKRVLGLPLDSLDALLGDARARGLAERIVVTGFRRDVPRLLTAADVLAFPSVAAEGFGRPIIEAMAMARPVVATDVGPSHELLGPDAGLLVAPDAESLARGLAELLDTSERRARMGQAGRRRVEACFTLDRQVTEMSAIYGG
jgi:glycosyltransferase involved in cell wall biosynthesis